MVRWARAALIGIALVSMVSLLFMGWFFGQMLDLIASSGSEEFVNGPPPGFQQMMVLQPVIQIANLAQLAGMVLLAVWFYRAAAAAAALGLPARRTPGWAVAGWFIPVVNLWWPLQSSRDLLPAGHPMRGRMTLLWFTALVSAIATPLMLFPIMFNAITAMDAGTFEGAQLNPLLVVPSVVLATVYVLCRDVVSTVLETHEQLLAEGLRPG